MNRNVQMLLLKLADGSRLLRLSEQESGLCLEKRLDSSEPVFVQKKRWTQVFEAMLDREVGSNPVLKRIG
jgi:hypothetical protein